MVSYGVVCVVCMYGVACVVYVWCVCVFWVCVRVKQKELA